MEEREGNGERGEGVRAGAGEWEEEAKVAGSWAVNRVEIIVRMTTCPAHYNLCFICLLNGLLVYFIYSDWREVAAVRRYVISSQGLRGGPCEVCVFWE